MTQTTQSNDKQTNQDFKIEPTIDHASVSSEDLLHASTASPDAIERSRRHATEAGYDTESFGNAIEKQKYKAQARQASYGSDMESSGYEYHYDRILMAIIVILLVLTVFGWGAYLMSGSPVDPLELSQGESIQEDRAQNKNSNENAPSANSVDDGEQATDVVDQGFSAPVNDKNAAQAQEKMSSPEPLEPSNAGEPMTAPEQPAMELSSRLDAENPPSQSSPAAANTGSANNSTDTAATGESQGVTRPNSSGSSNRSPLASASEEQRLVVYDDSIIARSNLSSGVRNYEPIGVYTDGVVSLNGRPNSRVFWFTEITNSSDQQLSHQWFYNNELVAKVDVNVGSSSWRATTNKLITQNTLGQWRVAAVNPQGETVAEQFFTVQP